MRDVESLLTRASFIQRIKLQEKSYKPGWGNLTLQELLKLSDGETVELKMAVYIFEQNMCDRTKALKEIQREAADRMNYDAMIIEKCDKLLEKKG
jgi:hypothetical protein